MFCSKAKLDGLEGDENSKFFMAYDSIRWEDQMMFLMLLGLGRDAVWIHRENHWLIFCSILIMESLHRFFNRDVEAGISKIGDCGSIVSEAFVRVLDFGDEDSVYYLGKLCRGDMSLVKSGMRRFTSSRKGTSLNGSFKTLSNRSASLSLNLVLRLHSDLHHVYIKVP
ncbi:hypothetical protein Tco_0553730 [Tanacetum coccineum]